MRVPAARREVLVLMAGIVWSAVGLVLIAMAAVWLHAYHGNLRLPVVLVAIVGGVLIYRFGFSKLARMNIDRIYSQAPSKKRVCVFAFQNARSYVMVIIMMSMGYGLRHSPLPKIDLALVLSSLHYYNHLRHNENAAGSSSTIHP
jgi:hypothetical protein